MVAILSPISAFILGILITPVLIHLFKKMDLIDAPGGRKIHINSTPSMGGIGIMSATFYAVFIWFEYDQIVEIRYLLAAVGLVLFVGIRDDLVSLKVWEKMAAQMVATYMVVFMADIRITSWYGFLDIHELPFWLSTAITFLIIIALTNAFNLIDGLDGLAGIISLMAFSFLGWWFWYSGMEGYAMFSLILVGGIASFLIFNWHPAKIFMGDSGSLSLGFALSVMTILFIDTNGTMETFQGWKFNAPIASGIALLIIPIYDTLRIFVKRMINGKSPMEPDKSHIHHFLLRMGLRHDLVTLSLALVNVSFLALIFLGSELTDHQLLPIIIILALLLGLSMDFITLNMVKKNNRKSPPILSLRSNPHKYHKKPEIQEKILRKAKLSDN